jgi:hypothetical protein
MEFPDSWIKDYRKNRLHLLELPGHGFLLLEPNVAPWHVVI